MSLKNNIKKKGHKGLKKSKNLLAQKMSLVFQL